MFWEDVSAFPVGRKKRHIRISTGFIFLSLGNFSPPRMFSLCLHGAPQFSNLAEIASCENELAALTKVN